MLHVVSETCTIHGLITYTYSRLFCCMWKEVFEA